MGDNYKDDADEYPVKEHINVKVIKKSGNLEAWNSQKILNAVGKSAARIATKLSYIDQKNILEIVEHELDNNAETEVSVETIHSLVEKALAQVRPDVAISYMDYRNWVKRNAKLMDEVTRECNTIQFIGDKSNANADSNMVSTKRVKKLDVLETTQYREYFLNSEEKKAEGAGYIYIHDKGARQDTMNCCIFDVNGVLSGGFEMGNVWYNEPKSLDVAFDVIGDITLMAASQQYGGFTIPEVDKLLSKYAEKTYQSAYKEEYEKLIRLGIPEEIAQKEAKISGNKQVKKEMRQGYQGWEYKFNTVASSRGDYPFLTITFGLATDKWGKLASKTILRVHADGQGKDGMKKPVLFPKLVFLYDENLHSEGCVNYDIFEAGVQCSSKTMYPKKLGLMLAIA